MDVTFGPPRNSLKCEVVDHSACLVVIDEATRFEMVYAVDSTTANAVDKRSLVSALKDLKADIALIQSCKSAEQKKCVGQSEGYPQRWRW